MPCHNILKLHTERHKAYTQHFFQGKELQLPKEIQSNGSVGNKSEVAPISTLANQAPVGKGLDL